MRPQRPCLVCGDLHRNQGARCTRCQQKRDHHRNQRRAHYTGNWQATSRKARQAEPWCHCTRPGHGHDGQPCWRTDDLTLDHEDGQVQCRSCNSSHHGRVYQ